jgi:fructokinase
MPAEGEPRYPLILGEVLFDCFPDGRAVLGGAPLNVAWHLRALGAVPLLVTAVGDDRAGARVRAAMTDWGLDTRGVQVVPGRPTGQVRVRLGRGSPSFEIPPDQAWDHLSPDGAARQVEGAPTLLYHGTLFLRGAANRSLAARLGRARRLPVFLDVNLRAPWWSPALLGEVLPGVRWLKLNAEELEVLGPETAGQRPARRAAALRERTGVEAVFLTLGAAGAVLSTAGETLEAPAPGVEVVDTVGAGDAFSAAAILGLLRGWEPDLTLARALRLAGAVCGIPGATPSEQGFYRPIAADWA